MGDDGTAIIGVSEFTSADFGGAPIFELSGAHLDTVLPGTGYTVTDTSLIINFTGNRIEFGTAAQLPEPSSLALLPLGLLALGWMRKKVYTVS